MLFRMNPYIDHGIPKGRFLLQGIVYAVDKRMPHLFQSGLDLSHIDYLMICLIWQSFIGIGQKIVDFLSLAN